MKKNFVYFFSAFMLVFAAGCSQEEDVAPMATQSIGESTSISQDAKKSSGTGLQNIKVSKVLSDGSTLVGTVSITSFDYDNTDGLLVNGVLAGTVTALDGTITVVEQTFSNIAATLDSRRECQILFLDLGPIFLDVLGLQVDLSRIVLDITAVSGAGNLLGNLLCAIAGLLDPGTGLLDLIDNLGQLNDLIAQINEILSGLLG